jgi:hypothetical protein
MKWPSQSTDLNRIENGSSMQEPKTVKSNRCIPNSEGGREKTDTIPGQTGVLHARRCEAVIQVNGFPTKY